MNYKKIVDITAAVNPPKYPCVFSSLSNNTVSTCNMTKFFFIVLTSAKFCASGLTSHSFLLSHDCLTQCIVLNVTKWTFLVPNFGVFLLQKQGFLYDVFEDSQYSTSWFQVRSSVNDFSFLVHDCKEKNMCVGLPIFAVWERENYYLIFWLKKASMTLICNILISSQDFFFLVGLRFGAMKLCNIFLPNTTMCHQPAIQTFKSEYPSARHFR